MKHHLADVEDLARRMDRRWTRELGKASMSFEPLDARIESLRQSIEHRRLIEQGVLPPRRDPASSTADRPA